MNQNLNLYQISKANFEEFSKNHESFNFDFSEDNSSVFDQNFEGLIFLFSSYYLDQLPKSLEELFYPQNFIGDNLDFSEIDFDTIEDFPESTSIYFLNPITIKEINSVLENIKNDDILDFYNANLFNTYDVYPKVWHDDESEDQAFNKRHLEEGLVLLKQTISKANANENYILFFN